MSQHPFQALRRRAAANDPVPGADAAALAAHLALPARERMVRTMQAQRELRLAERWGRRSDRPWELHERAAKIGIPLDPLD